MRLKFNDLIRILTEPESSLIKQYVALMSVENVTLNITKDAIIEIANIAAEINEGVENIGARRLHTVLEKLLEEISFTASERNGEKIIISDKIVKATLSSLAKNADLRKFIL